MPTSVPDGVRWNTAEDFYDAFLEAVGAPSWHGHNLDALYDSIGGDDINTVRHERTGSCDGQAISQAD